MANSTLGLRIADKHSGPDVINALRGDLINYIYDGSCWWWRQRCTVVGGFIGAVELAAATSQEIDLHEAFPNNLFPANVHTRGGVLQLHAVGAGGDVSALTAALGDDADGDALVTASNVFTGATLGLISTPAAAEYPGRAERAFIPELLLASVGDDLDAVAGLDLTVWIPWTPLPAAMHA
jgi:hypothetical protein